MQECQDQSVRKLAMADESSPFRNTVLKGKVALITGGGSGIGFEIATQYGLHGAMVAIMGRRRNVLDAAVASLERLGIKVSTKQFQIHRTIASVTFLELILDCNCRPLEWRETYARRKTRAVLWRRP